MMSTQFNLLRDGVHIRQELSRVIASATKSLCLMMYIFCNDKAGNDILSELVEALQRGVRVRIILDGFGSLLTPHRFFAPIYQAGGHIQKFNTRWHPRYLFRNHQKFVIADGQIALTGGFNIADQYFGDGVESGWRDTGWRAVGATTRDDQRTDEDNRSSTTARARHYFLLGDRQPCAPGILHILCPPWEYSTVDRPAKMLIIPS